MDVDLLCTQPNYLIFQRAFRAWFICFGKSHVLRWLLITWHNLRLGLRISAREVIASNNLSQWRHHIDSYLSVHFVWRFAFANPPLSLRLSIEQQFLAKVEQQWLPKVQLTMSYPSKTLVSKIYQLQLPLIGLFLLFSAALCFSGRRIQNGD